MREVDKLARAIRFASIFVLAVLAVKLVFGLGKDATDTINGRSGMALLTDAETGCQYLARDGLTPRLDRDGKHMCGN